MSSCSNEVEPPTPKSTPDSGRSIACKNCDTFITSTNDLLSQSYWGLLGRAALIREITPGAATRSEPTAQMLMSGAAGDTVCVLTCRACTTYLGWEIVRAHARADRWKEGRSMLELERVGEQTGLAVHIRVPAETQKIYRTPEQKRKDARRLAFSQTARVLEKRVRVRV